MPGRRAREVGNLPTHPDKREFAFEDVLDGLGEGADGEYMHNVISSG
jgi:hypothetical protein